MRWLHCLIDLLILLVHYMNFVASDVGVSLVKSSPQYCLVDHVLSTPFPQILSTNLANSITASKFLTCFEACSEH